MSEAIGPEDGWQPCPVGALSQYARGERGRRRRGQLLKFGGGVGVVLLLIGASLLAFSSKGSREPNFGGITCTEVRRHASEYRAGQVDEDLAAKIRIHLEQCPDCQSRWKIMMQEQATVSHSEMHASHCSCVRCARDAAVPSTRSDRYLAWRPSSPVSHR